MRKYALISNQVREVDNIRYDGNKVHFDVVHRGFFSCEKPRLMCTVTLLENFILGSKEELETIILKEKKEIESKIKNCLAKFPNANTTEKTILKFLIEDGYEVEEIDNDFLDYTVNKVLIYMECNSSLEDAYFDYMH